MSRYYGFIVIVSLAVCSCSPNADFRRFSANRANPAEAEQVVRAVVANILNVDAADIKMDQAISSLEADELDLVEIVIELEERFGISISDSALDRILEQEEVGSIPITPNQFVTMVREAATDHGDELIGSDRNRPNL